MIVSKHKNFKVYDLPMEDSAWNAIGDGFMYLNVFDVRDAYGDWDMDVTFLIMEAFRSIYPDIDYEYNKDPEFKQICFYTRDMDWQLTARLLDVDQLLFSKLEQVVHRVSVKTGRYLIPKHA